MKQVDLFGPYNGEAPSQRHSETSRAAAAKIMPRRGRLHVQIENFLAATGGATDEQMQDGIPMGANTQRPRRRELQLMGRVADSGQRKLTRSGQLAVVWCNAKR